MKGASEFKINRQFRLDFKRHRDTTKYYFRGLTLYIQSLINNNKHLTIKHRNYIYP